MPSTSFVLPSKERLKGTVIRPWQIVAGRLPILWHQAIRDHHPNTMTTPEIVRSRS